MTISIFLVRACFPAEKTDILQKTRQVFNQIKEKGNIF